VTSASIIVPTLNGARFLPACLDALRRQTRPADEVVVVDDGSTDNTASLLAASYPEVRLVAHPRPRGVAAGFNTGIHATNGEVVVLLNNDTEAETTWLESLLAPLDAERDVQLAASKLLLFDRRDTLHSAGDFYGRDGMPGSRGVWETDRGQFDACLEPFGPCGAAAAYRRSALEALGFFDETLGSYCEDVDVSFRARLAGFSCRFVPRARVYHRLSATGGGSLASYFVGRNVLWVLAQNTPAQLLDRYWPRIVASQAKIAAEAARHWREPAARARLRGQVAGLRGLAARTHRRAAVQKTRQVSIAALDALLS
jgi:GT2 family glycosyltransferase